MPRFREFRWDSWAKWARVQIQHDKPRYIAIDTETEGLGFHDKAFCCTLSWRARTGALKSAYIDLAEDEWKGRRAQLFQILSVVQKWVFWNAKFDLQKLDYLGALPDFRKHTIEDGQPLASLLDENRRMALKVRAVEDLGHVDTIEVEIKSGPRKGQTKLVAKEEHNLAAVRRKLKLTKDDGYHLLPREVLIPYALKDTELTLRWWEKYRPLLPADLEEVYAEEIELIHVLREMEANGLGVDVPYLEESVDEWGAKEMVASLTLAELIDKTDFNPNSVPQLKAAFASLGVELESTDKAAMRAILVDDKTPENARALAAHLHEYREAAKTHGTYLRPLLNEQRDGVAHPWINATGPRTGRTSSSTARS